MPILITMPRLSDTMEEGTLVSWKVKVGDKVAAGDHLADIETDKATMELQAFDDGTVAKVVVQEGETVPIETAILVLAVDGESVEDAAAADLGQSSAPAAAETDTEAPSRNQDQDQDQEPASAPAAGGQAPAATGTAEAAATGSRIRTSPLARKLAEEMGVDLTAVSGTGPDGRIIKRDVLKAAEAGTRAPEQSAATKAASGPATAGDAGERAVPAAAGPRLEARTVKLTQMRKTIARRLVESKTQVPHFQVSVAIDMDPLLELRGTLNAQLASQGIKLSVNDFVTRAVALATTQHPAINSSWDADAITFHGTVNVGVAISLPAESGGGLVVATVRDAHLKGLRQLSAEVKELAGRARSGGLSLEEMSGSTITISNLGMPQYGVTQFTAIINPPNAAIIAVGAAIQKPVVRDGQLAVGHEMNVTLSGDHRVIDGAVGAEFLTTLRGLIENPAALLV